MGCQCVDLFCGGEGSVEDDGLDVETVCCLDEHASELAAAENAHGTRVHRSNCQIISSGRKYLSCRSET